MDQRLNHRELDRRNFSPCQNPQQPLPATSDLFAPLKKLEAQLGIRLPFFSVVDFRGTESPTHPFAGGTFRWVRGQLGAVWHRCGDGPEAGAQHLAALLRQLLGKAAGEGGLVPHKTQACRTPNIYIYICVCLCVCVCVCVVVLCCVVLCCVVLCCVVLCCVVLCCVVLCCVVLCCVVLCCVVLCCVVLCCVVLCCVVLCCVVLCCVVLCCVVLCCCVAFLKGTVIPVTCFSY